MKKILAVILVLACSGCTARYVVEKEYIKAQDYKYDRLWSSVVLALAENNYTPVEFNKEAGVITAQNYALRYSYISLGLFLLFPSFYTIYSYPVVTVVFKNGKNSIWVLASETTTPRAIANIENFLFQRVEHWYSRSE